MARTKKADGTIEETQDETTPVTPSEELPELIEKPKEEPKPVDEKPYTESYFEMLGRPIPKQVEFDNGYCLSCQEKIRTGLHGESICPAMLNICPRHSG